MAFILIVKDRGDSFDLVVNEEGSASFPDECAAKALKSFEAITSMDKGPSIRFVGMRWITDLRSGYRIAASIGEIEA